MTSEIKISNITNRTGTSGAVIAGVTSSIGTGYAKMPSGDNSQRVGIESGSIRYNSTAKVLEFYDGTQWNFILPAEESANALGVFGGGGKTIDYITISTLGNATYFGDLTVGRAYLSACSSSTRGIFGGGYIGGGIHSNTLDYITITTTGNATDFGDLLEAFNQGVGACSSSTRGVFVVKTVSTNVLEYITIATTGNSNNFGNLFSYRRFTAGCSSNTRGVFGGGYSVPGVVPQNTIDYITIASQGTNAQDFGDLTSSRSGIGACSSSTRGVFGGGYYIYSPYTSIDTIDYITISTTGNATNFGDLTYTGGYIGACSSSTRGVFAGLNLTSYNSIDYITIATTGNATDFGDLSVARGALAACSNNHGGLL